MTIRLKQLWRHGKLPCLLAWALALLLLGGAQPATAVTSPPLQTAGGEGSTIPLADYWEYIHRLQILVERLAAQTERPQQTGLAAAADELAAITAVSLPDGSTLPLDHTLLLRQLRADPPDLDQLTATLTTLLATQERWPEPQFATLDQAQLDRILARPEFQYETPASSAWETWWLNVQQRFWEWIARLLPAGNTVTGRLLNQILTFVGAVVLAVVLFLALRSLVADFAAQARLAPAATPHDELLTADSALQRAQQLSGAGDYRTAVRYLYLSSLLLLEERGLLRYDRTLTNREYLRTVAHRPELVAILREVVDVFDRVWYGYQPLDQADYGRYAARVEALRHQRQRP